MASLSKAQDDSAKGILFIPIPQNYEVKQNSSELKFSAESG